MPYLPSASSGNWGPAGSLLIASGIDGRHGVPAVFDGLNPRNGETFPLKLKPVERREKDTIWLRYERQASGQPGL